MCFFCNSSEAGVACAAMLKVITPAGEGHSRPRAAVMMPISHLILKLKLLVNTISCTRRAMQGGPAVTHHCSECGGGMAALQHPP